MRQRRTAWRSSERGAVLVEFAILLPIVLMLTFGMITAGLEFNRKLSISNSAREGSRYGATLPVDNFGDVNAWLDDVAAVTIGSAGGDLADGVAGRRVCVALIGDAGGRRDQLGTAAPVYGAGECYSDGRPADEERVQVLAQRDGEIDAVFFDVQVTLTGEAVSRFEIRQ